MATNFLLSLYSVHAFWLLLGEMTVGLALNVSQWLRDKIRLNCTTLQLCEVYWIHFGEWELWGLGEGRSISQLFSQICSFCIKSVLQCGRQNYTSTTVVE